MSTFSPGEIVVCNESISPISRGHHYQVEATLTSTEVEIVYLEGFPSGGFPARCFSKLPLCAQSVHVYPAALREVIKEHDGAAAAWPKFNSAHEGFSILAEEVDELWDHVKMKPQNRDVKAMRKEAVQVAAMALRFIIDCCDNV